MGEAGTCLLRSIPLSPVPLFVQQELVVFVGDDGGGESPRTFEARAIGVAPSESVGTAQSDNLLVIEAHAAEDIAQVLVALGSIWQTSIGCARSHLLVESASPEWDGRTLHFLDGDDSAENPEVGVGDPRELLCRQRFSVRPTN